MFANNWFRETKGKTEMNKIYTKKWPHFVGLTTPSCLPDDVPSTKHMDDDQILALLLYSRRNTQAQQAIYKSQSMTAPHKAK